MNELDTYSDYPEFPELYDLIPINTDRRDLDFYRQYAQAVKGRILELGCGTGRVLIPIAEAGCQITGLDISENMLTRCRKKVDSLPPDVQERIKLVHGNMASFNLDDIVHLAITPFRPFQHLVTVKSQVACLRNVNRQLAPKGKLILDLFQVDYDRINDPKRTEEQEDVPEFELADGRRLRRTHRVVAFHTAEQYLDVELIHYLTDTDGNTRRLVHAFPMRYFFRYEVEHLLHRCGFEVIDLFGDYDRTPLDDQSPEMIFVAEKRQTVG